MLRIINLNVNGLRSAQRKGLIAWLEADSRWQLVCLQEIKAHDSDLSELHTPKHAESYFYPADKKGYSGVGLYCRRKPDRVVKGFGDVEFDREGRYLQADFGKLSVVSLYLPSGSSSEERQQAKFRFMEVFFPHLSALAKSKREVLLCGDWNIAHKEIDLKNWRSNQKNSGFLPEERTWLSRVFDELHWVDVFRRLDPRAEQYTWWSNRGQAWSNNVGWRIDYQIATPGIAAKATSAAIYKQQRFSDHAPLTIDYDYVLD